MNRKRKYVYKITPMSLYNIRELENWLETQASQCLFPVQVTGDFARFRRWEAIPNTRFRLEAANGREYPEPERLELYRQAGWEYIGMVPRLYFLFYSTDPDAPELHTDPVTRGLSLDWLAKTVRQARRRTRIVRLVMLGALFLSVVLLWNKFPRRLPLLLADLSGTALLFLLWFLWLWRREEGETRRLLDFQRSLELGIAPAPVFYTKSWLLFWPFTAAIILLLVGGQLYGRPIPLENFSRPYLNLQQLESEPLTDYETLFGNPPSHAQDNCTVTRKFSLLSPSCYTVNQNLFSLKAGTKENFYSITGEPECRYSPDLEAVYFHLTVPALERMIAEAQLAQLEFVNLNWRYEELSYPGLDFVILARAEHFPEWQLAAAGRSGHVIALRYGGREDLAAHLDVLAPALGQ